MNEPSLEKVSAEGQGQWRGVVVNKTHGGYNFTVFVPQGSSGNLKETLDWPIDTPISWGVVQVPQQD